HCLSHHLTLFGGFAPPAARQTAAVFFMIFAPRCFCTSNWKEPKDERKILNKIAIVTNQILSAPLEQRVGTAWLYKEKECIIFDTNIVK
ncbi:hypothetical protein NG821_12345, partial [Prevotella cerevisiae]